jgi:hypothetical protein
MQMKTPGRHGLLRLPLLRLLAINLAIGFGIAALIVGGLLALDPGGLRHLILDDRAPGVALALLTMSFFITFGSAAMGTAIMALGRRDDDPPPRGGTPAHGEAALARVKGR